MGSGFLHPGGGILEDFRYRFQKMLHGLHPGYFALVMATGIISVAAYNLGMDRTARFLFLVARAAYLLLSVLTAIRFLSSPKGFARAVAGYEEGPAFFSLVAATSVLGTAYVYIGSDAIAGFVLWISATILWLLFSYTFITAVIIRPSKPAMEAALNPGWLLSVVATQAVSILGTMVSSVFPAHEGLLLFAMLLVYLLGIIFYVLLITAIIHRMLFFSFTPEKFTPLYWVAMGASAITTLAGVTLDIATERSAVLSGMLPFLRGLSLLFWAFTTWWIPLLAALTIWKHVFKRYPLEYDVEYWGMIFPLGMYTFATYQVAVTNAIGFIFQVSGLFIYIALAAWLITFIAFIKRFILQLHKMSHSGPGDQPEKPS